MTQIGMTKQTRRILFFIAFLFFIIATPILVEYSRGLRLDFKTWKFVETGGFFFKIYSPSEVQISIDGKTEKTTGSFSFLNSAFLQNLTPGFYNVRISKEGYQDWQKTLKIDPQLVTEAHNIVLASKNLKVEQYSSAKQKIVKFYSSPSKKYLAFVKSDEKNQTILGVVDLVSQKEKEILLSKNYIDIELSEWQEDYNKILFVQKINDKTDYILADTALGEVNYLSAILSKQAIVKNMDNIKIASANDIFILKGNLLYVFNLTKKTLELAKKDILSFKMHGGILYYFTQSDYLFRKAYFKNGVLASEEIIGTMKLKINENPEFDIRITSSDWIFVLEKNDGLLVEFFSKEGGFSKIDDGVSDFRISGDGKKILYSKDSQLWVYYEDDIKIQPFKYKDQKELVVKSSQPIISYQWFQTDNHIIYGLENGVKMIELDTRDNVNLYNLVKLTNPEMFYDNSEELLYILSEETLYTADILANE